VFSCLGALDDWPVGLNHLQVWRMTVSLLLGYLNMAYDWFQLNWVRKTLSLHPAGCSGE
jgi:hypothetical protein